MKSAVGDVLEALNLLETGPLINRAGRLPCPRWQ
jgi:hypothetical protein